MSRPRLHYHSDCPFFAGCENMLANFFSDAALAREYELSFSYRSSPEYEKGLRARVPSPPNPAPLSLLDVDAALDALGPAALPLRPLARLIPVRAASARINTGKLRGLLDAVKPSILHVNNGGWPGAYSCQSAVLAAQDAGVSKIVYVVNNMALGYGLKRWGDRSLDAAVASAVTRFVTATTAAADRLSEVLRLPAGKVAVIPNGIAPRMPKKSRAETRRRLGVPEDRVAVASVAVFEPRKGHAHLLRALARLEKRPLLLIEGVGPEEAALKALAKELKLGDDARFLGREDSVFDLLAAVDGLVETSVSHSPSPNIVAEAMSLGLPVLGSAASSSEQLEHGKTGLLVDPSNESALSRELQSFFDPALLARLGAAAKEAFARKFSAEASVARYRELYSSL